MLIFTRIAQFCRHYLNSTKKAPPTEIIDDLITNPSIISRNNHSISRKSISKNTLKVLYRLHKSGYEAYLVGGSIRDLVLGEKPKDFDVATNATPEQIKNLFRNSRLIGRRFRLAHIIFGAEIIEVATFRAAHQPEIHKDLASQNRAGMLLRDNVYGSLQEDALRRDFTINSLYYNPVDFTIIDYANGWQDLADRIIRLIGDPETRYREDPVRMLRAIRFQAKLNMQITPETAAPIKTLAPLLNDIPAARLFEESLKLLQSGTGVKTYQLLCHFALFKQLFPLIDEHFTASCDSLMEQLILLVLKNTDHRLKNNKRVNPAFLFAAMLWYPVVELAQKLSQESGLHYYDSFALATNEILDRQCRTLAIPKRLTNDIRDIWQLQLRLPQRTDKKVYRLLTHPKFRAAFDLLELRGEIEKGALLALAQWWADFQQASPAQQKKLIINANLTHPTRKRHHKAHYSRSHKSRTARNKQP